MTPSGNRASLAALLAIVLVASDADSQSPVPTVLIAVGDALPDGTATASVGVPQPTNAGGLVLSAVDGEARQYLIGSPSGGAWSILRQPEQIGPYSQLFFTDWAVDSFGRFTYGTQLTVSPSTDVLVGLWNDDDLVFVEGDAVASLATEYVWTRFLFGVYRLETGTLAWFGRAELSSGGGPVDGLWIGEDQQLVFGEGQTLPGLLPIQDVSSAPRLSPSGNHYVSEVRLSDFSSTVIVDGAGMVIDGSLLKSGNTVPAALGGLPGETFSFFEVAGVDDLGRVTLRAVTSQRELAVHDGAVLFETGDVVDGISLLEIRDLAVNSSGDVVYWTRLAFTTFTDVAIFLNDELALFVPRTGPPLNGTPIDLDGDGVADPGATVKNVSSLGRRAITDRDPWGLVTHYLIGWVDTQGTAFSLNDDVVGVLATSIQAGPVTVRAAIDVNPSACPNTIGNASVTRLAILGSMELDVLDIDLTSLRLERQDGVGSAIAPSMHVRIGDSRSLPDRPGACSLAGPDGFVDLELRVSTHQLLTGLRFDLVPGGAEVPLVLSGTLITGEPLAGRDLVVASSGPIAPGPTLGLR